MKETKLLSACFLLFFSFLFSQFSLANDDLIIKLLKLPAPPPPNPILHKDYRNDRNQSFYDPTKPPSEDAPIADILDYWEYWSTASRDLYHPKPSKKVLERIKKEIRKNHELILRYLDLFSDDVDFVKEIYDEETAYGEADIWWQKTVKDWLVYNSNYFTSELFSLTQKTLKETEYYVEGINELKALAKVDWNQANLIIQRLITDNSKPGLQILAKWMLYRHSIEIGDEAEAERLREELKRIVADKSQKDGLRDLALDALLLEKEFPGRDEWYFSLMEDETLLGLKSGETSFTGLTTLIRISEPDKYTNKLLELLESDNKTIRSAAANLLINSHSKFDQKVLRALLPLLSQPDWIPDSKLKESLKRALIERLSEVKIPESVPALIILLRKEIKNLRKSGDDGIYFVSSIVYALGNQRDQRAIPILWEAFSNTSEYYTREGIVGAIFLCGGFSLKDQVDAVEKRLRYKPETLEDEVLRKPPEIQIKIMLGNYILYNKPQEISGELMLALFERIKSLKKEDPDLSMRMRRALLNLDISFLNKILLLELGENNIDVEGIIKLLAQRKEIREKYLNDLYSASTRNSFAEGISACIMENGYKQILEGENSQAKAALLACARLIRAELPINSIYAILKSENKLLFDAAIKYLETEDSPEARQIILSIYPEQAKILGANPFFGDAAPGELNELLSELFKTVFPPYSDLVYFNMQKSLKRLKEEERKLQEEVLQNGELLGIYSYNGNIVRIYKDRAIFTWRKNNDFYIERPLKAEEFERLKKYIAETKAESLPPFISSPEGEVAEISTKELLMLGKGGGRRVFLLTFYPDELEWNKNLSFFKRLESIFEDLRSKPGKLRYELQDYITNFEVLYYGQDLEIKGVWKKNNDLRVLVKDNSKLKELKKQDQEKILNSDNSDEDINSYNYESKIGLVYSWHSFENNGFKETVSPPDGFSFAPYDPFFNNFESSESWKGKTSSFSLFLFKEFEPSFKGWFVKKDLSSGKEEKLFSLDICSPGLESTIVVSSNGKWAWFCEKPQIYNLQTKKAINILIDYDEAHSIKPIAYISSLNKFLVVKAKYFESVYELEDDDSLDYEYESAYQIESIYLVDPITGSAQSIGQKGLPLLQQTWHPLQPFMNKTDEFWVAQPDKKNRKTTIGVFNVRNLTFKPLIQLPKIVFNSMNMWVDEQEKKAYIAHGGNLLRIKLPLP
jgi:HEAT repeat protein